MNDDLVAYLDVACEMRTAPEADAAFRIDLGTRPVIALPAGHISSRVMWVSRPLTAGDSGRAVLEVICAPEVRDSMNKGTCFTLTTGGPRVLADCRIVGVLRPPKG